VSERLLFEEHKSHGDLPEKAQAQTQGLCLTMRDPDGPRQFALRMGRDFSRPTIPLTPNLTQVS